MLSTPSRVFLLQIANEVKQRNCKQRLFPRFHHNEFVKAVLATVTHSILANIQCFHSQLPIFQAEFLQHHTYFKRPLSCPTRHMIKPLIVNAFNFGHLIRPSIVNMSSNSTTLKTQDKPDQSASSANPQEEPSKSDQSTNTTSKTTAFTNAWGSTSGKPFLSSPRLDDPKSSSIIRSYFNPNPSKKETASGSEADKTD